MNEIFPQTYFQHFLTESDWGGPTKTGALWSPGIWVDLGERGEAQMRNKWWCWRWWWWWMWNKPLIFKYLLKLKEKKSQLRKIARIVLLESSGIWDDLREEGSHKWETNNSIKCSFKRGEDIELTPLDIFAAKEKTLCLLNQILEAQKIGLLIPLRVNVGNFEPKAVLNWGVV